MEYTKQELYHYGILGMKWGVRRYQNFDGSYTKAGLERYRKAENTYEKRKGEYKRIKSDKTKSRYEKKYAKAKLKESQRELKKHYKHLELDRKGDLGKMRYARGERITSNYQKTAMVAKLGTAVSIGSRYLSAQGVIDKDVADIAMFASIGLTAVSGMKNLLDEIPNSQLRAYYAHTSRY